MKKTLRLLVPRKQGVGRRINDAIASARGVVEHTRIARPMRGITVTEITVSCADAAAAAAVVQAVERLKSVTIVGVEDVAESQLR